MAVGRTGGGGGFSAQKSNFLCGTSKNSSLPLVNSSPAISGSGVEALGQCLNFPDFEVQETALQILLRIAPILPYNYFVSTVLPSHVRGYWYQITTSPTDYILRRLVLTKFNWDKPLMTSAVLSLKVRNSVYYDDRLQSRV